MKMQTRRCREVNTGIIKRHAHEDTHWGKDAAARTKHARHKPIPKYQLANIYEGLIRIKDAGWKIQTPVRAQTQRKIRSHRHSSLLTRNTCRLCDKHRLSRFKKRKRVLVDVVIHACASHAACVRLFLCLGACLAVGVFFNIYLYRLCLCMCICSFVFLQMFLDLSTFLFSFFLCPFVML